MQFTETSLWKPQGVAGGSTSDSAGVTSFPVSSTQCPARMPGKHHTPFHVLGGIYTDVHWANVQIGLQISQNMSRKSSKRKIRVKWWKRKEKKASFHFTQLCKSGNIGLRDWNWLLRGGCKGTMCFPVSLILIARKCKILLDNLFLMKYKLLKICSLEYWFFKKEDPCCYFCTGLATFDRSKVSQQWHYWPFVPDNYLWGKGVLFSAL